jgi:hypothetical protein
MSQSKTNPLQAEKDTILDFMRWARRRGYAVEVLSPAEMQGADPDEVESAMWRAGRAECGKALASTSGSEPETFPTKNEVDRFVDSIVDSPDSNFVHD